MSPGRGVGGGLNPNSEKSLGLSEPQSPSASHGSNGDCTGFPRGLTMPLNNDLSGSRGRALGMVCPVVNDALLGLLGINETDQARKANTDHYWSCFHPPWCLARAGAQRMSWP